MSWRKIYGAKTVGVVLTGQLDDGTAGLLAIKDRGGVAIVQDPLEATAPSMPKSAMRHVSVDHVCSIKKLAPLLTQLAADPPTLQPPDPSRLMEIEARIALGVSTLDDWVLRFRCRSGHGFSSESLLSGQADARENLLDSLFGALLDEASLAARMAQLPEHAQDPVLLRALSDRADRLRGEAEQIGTWLHGTAGLVEPEPPP